MSTPEGRQTLARYPYPVMRVACRYCERRGQYLLERLIETHGRDITFEQLLIKLSADCTRASDRTSRPSCRGAYLPDLVRRRGSFAFAVAGPPIRTAVQLQRGGATRLDK